LSPFPDNAGVGTGRSRLKHRLSTKAQALFACCAVLATPALVQARSQSPHALASAENPYDFETMENPVPEPGRPTRGLVTDRLDRIVYGWYPYWAWKKNADGTWPQPPRMRWDLLSHVSYFSVELGVDGTIAADQLARLSSPTYANLRSTSRAYDVKLTITFTNFEDKDVATLCSPAVRPTAISTLVQAVKNADADGLNIDFEFVPLTARDDFSAFMAELTAAMHAEIPGSHVTLAGPTVSSRANYDYDALLAETDGIIPMFYGCAGAWSERAGPNAPLTGGSAWPGLCNLQWVTDDYLKWGGTEQRKKVIMGLPFYGNSWVTADDSIGSTALSSKGAVIYKNILSTYRSERRWDADSQTPWTSRIEGGQTIQTWCDDGESFGMKLDYLVQRDVGGIGIWALSYDGESDDYWNQIEAHFTSGSLPGNLPLARVVADVRVPLGKEVVLDGSKSSDPQGLALSYEWKQLSGPSVTLSSTTDAKPRFTPTQIGAYRFWLVVSNATQKSVPVETTVRVLQAMSTEGQSNRDNMPPTAVPSATLAQGTLILLDGSKSTDPEGVNLWYAWAQTDGPSVSMEGTNGGEPITRVVAPQPGTYTFSLRVSDGFSDSEPASVSVTVKKAGTPNFGVSAAAGDSTGGGCAQQPAPSDQILLFFVCLMLIRKGRHALFSTPPEVEAAFSGAGISWGQHCGCVGEEMWERPGMYPIYFKNLVVLPHVGVNHNPWCEKM
jgi:spore germination protein YaaH